MPVRSKGSVEKAAQQSRRDEEPLILSHHGCKRWCLLALYHGLSPTFLLSLRSYIILNMSIVDSLASVKATIPEGVELIAVSKTHPAECILEAYNAGQRAFGENKVQELVPKYEALPKDIAWHLIGHLQRNKVKLVVPFVRLIHSVDSERLLATISQEGAKVERIVDCLIQVHIAQEATKFGFLLDEAREFFASKRWAAYPNARVVGLMGMATLTEDHAQIRREFHTLHALFEEVRSKKWVDTGVFSTLSMGMSGDYRIAIETGSTMVRVGSAVFGARVYKD